MVYTVVLLREDVGGYSVLVPALPGCFSQGDTVPEALQNAREAIHCHLASLTQHDEEAPADVDTVAFEWGDAQEAYVYRVVTRQEEALPVA